MGKRKNHAMLMQCSWNAHALWKIVPSLGAEDTEKWRKGSKFPLARYEA
jgi:hypothetical protein